MEPPSSGMSEGQFDPHEIDRPDRILLTYYGIISALTLIAFPIVFIPHWIKYETMRYSLDDEGVSMTWGYFFRREVYLTYRRIQDIHVTRNIIQRWLGLASVAIQTASGTAGVEMTIEGLLEPEKLRDYLYTKMRGAHGDLTQSEMPNDAEPVGLEPEADEATAILREIRDLLRERRAAQTGDQPKTDGGVEP